MIFFQHVPIEFLYNKSYSYYTSPAESYLYSRMKIVKADGSNISASDIIAPGQQFGLQLFNNIHVFINGTCTTYQPQHFPFRQAIEQLLTTSTAYQKSVLSQELFYRDHEKNMFTNANTGYQKRLSLASSSKSFELITRIGEFPFNCIRQLPPGIFHLSIKSIFSKVK